MAISRYSIMDAYVSEELKRDYEVASPQGRIQLLKKLQKGDQRLPFEIAMLAVHDPSSRVRQWFARYGNYDMGVEHDPQDGTRKLLEKRREARNLVVATLKGDSDVFVRACLRENPSAFGHFDGRPDFLEATHMERLALMRNPEVGTKLVEKVFDPEDAELGIDMDARRELCCAFITNKAKLHGLMDDAGLCPDHEGYWEAQSDAQKFLSALWRLALKWPDNSDIPALIFDEVPTNGLSFVEESKNPKYLKAEIYRAYPRWRMCILFTCDRRNDAVIQLALQDADEDCRKVAYSKLSFVPLGWVDEVIKRKDKAALEGLSQNETLSVEDLRKIQKCLNEINPAGFRFSWSTIDRKKKASVSQDPEQLFGKDGRGLLEEKVNFIGKTLTDTTAKNGTLTQKVSNALLWARVAGVAAVLVLVYLILR